MADALVPMYEGGSAPTWRTATLRVICVPSKGRWGLLALGDIAVRELAWAVRTLHQQHRLSGSPDCEVIRLGDLLPASGGLVRLELVTPWVLRREGPASGIAVPESIGQVQGEVIRNMLDRARCLTTLCCSDPRWQLLGAEYARGADPDWLGQQVQVQEGYDLRPPLLPKQAQDPMGRRAAPEVTTSRSNGGSFSLTAWEGHLELLVSPIGHRWLALLEVLGIGQATDKGYGLVRIIARTGA